MKYGTKRYFLALALRSSVIAIPRLGSPGLFHYIYMWARATRGGGTFAFVMREHASRSLSRYRSRLKWAAIDFAHWYLGVLSPLAKHTLRPKIGVCVVSYVREYAESSQKPNTQRAKCSREFLIMLCHIKSIFMMCFVQHLGFLLATNEIQKKAFRSSWAMQPCVNLLGAQSGFF